MAIDVSWYGNHKSIVCYTFDGEWTIEALCAAVDRAIELSATRPHRVHVLVDMRNSRTVLPSGIISHARYLNTKTPANQGHIVLLGLGDVAAQSFKLISPFMPAIRQRVRMVDSLEQAHHLLGLTQLEAI
jgi:hypothetical protein